MLLSKLNNNFANINNSLLLSQIDAYSYLLKIHSITLRADYSWSKSAFMFQIKCIISYFLRLS